MLGLTKEWVNKRQMRKFLWTVCVCVCGKMTVLKITSCEVDVWACVSLYKALIVVIYHSPHLSWLRINTTAVRKLHYSMKKKHTSQISY
jgi:hypothetical protein